MFGRKKCDELVKRIEDMEEKVKEANDPWYKKSKRIVSLQRLINPAEPFDVEHYRSVLSFISHLDGDQRAAMAKEVSDYYLELAKKCGWEGK